MSNLTDWFSPKVLLDLMRPDLIWMISTGGLLPYCILAIIIIFFVLYAIIRIFFIKRTFTIKNYVLTFLGALLIYYLLWVLLLIFFAIAIGRISQYI